MVDRKVGRELEIRTIDRWMIGRMAKWTEMMLAKCVDKWIAEEIIGRMGRWRKNWKYGGGG